jgi:hypothetical protein
VSLKPGQRMHWAFTLQSGTLNYEAAFHSKSGEKRPVCCASIAACPLTPPQRLFTPRLSHTDYVHPVNLSLPSPPCDPLACVPACRPLCSVGRARSCPELAPSAPVPLTTHGGGSWGRRRRSATRLTSSAEASGRTPTRPPRPSASSSSCCTTTPCAPPPPAAARRPRPRPADRARQSGWR